MPFSLISRIMKRSELLTVLVLCFLVDSAQPACAQSNRMDFRLKSEVKNSPADQMIHLAARGEERIISATVEQLGGVVLHRLRGLVAFRIHAGKISKLAQSDGVQQLEFGGHRGRALNDSMLVNNRVVAVHQGIPAEWNSLTGKDVVIGLVDTGIELEHPDFQHADGTTRVAYLWDQNQNGTAPEPFGYGAEWTAGDIDDGITGHQDQPQYFGHGSTVSGSAAGNGLSIEDPDYKGVAAEADLVVVSSSFGSANWTLTVADAIKYIFEKADEMGKPAVVNLSLGSYTGSHDGLDAAALIIDSLIAEQPGRVVVCAAGNSGNWPAYHLGYDVTSDTSFTWFQYNANSGLGYGAVFFELWADTADFENVHFSIGADRVNPSLQFRGRTPFRQVGEALNQVVTDSLKNGEHTLAVVDYYAELRGGQYQLQFHLANPDSSQYRFRLITTGAGRFDVWSTSILGSSNMVEGPLPTPDDFPEIANYRAPDKAKHTVSSWACSPKVITVGNYTNRDQYIDYNGNLQTFDPPVGELSVNSSHGPTRDNRLKPEISASGDMTMSAGKLSVLAALIVNEPFKVAPGGMHMRNGGTSMASPVVSGIAALLLEQCPYADWETIRNALLDNTYSDNFTGDSLNNAYGMGKADAEAALQSLLFQPVLEPSGEAVLCEGDILELSLTGDYDQYQWSTGSESPTLQVDTAGNYTVEVVNGMGCRGRSDTINVVWQTVPEVAIAQSFDTLMTMPDSNLTYQWFLNGQAVAGANGHFLVPDENGTYSLSVEDSVGCTAISNEIEYLITGEQFLEGNEWNVFPIPTDGTIYVEGTQPIDRLYVWSAEGRLVYSRIQSFSGNSRLEIDTEDWAPGMYMLVIDGEKDRETVRIVLN